MNYLWHHQISAIRESTDALNRYIRVCLRMATGAGKARVAGELIRDWLICGLKVSLYTERPEVFAELLCGLCMTTADRSVQNIVAYSVPECDDFQIGPLKTRRGDVPFADMIVSDGWNGFTQDLFCRHAERPAARWLVLTDRPVKPFFYDAIVACGTSEEVRACNGRNLWVEWYRRHKDSDLTFTSASVKFSIEYGFDPPDGVPFMPTTEWDMCRRLKDVPRERLT